MKRYYIFILAFLFSLWSFNIGQAEVTKWPHKTTTLVIPFGAGGSLDTMMRVLTRALEPELETRFKIDNRPGAASQVGTAVFINQKDNGSVLFGGTQLYLSATILLQGAKYDIDDFAMVNIEQFDPVTITVHKNSPYHSFKELIDDAKANPDEISYSTIHGGPLHLMGVLLEDKLATKFRPVFYSGGGEMRNALLGEHVDFMIGNALGDSAIADNVRVLAVDAEEVMELWPDALPMNEVLSEYGIRVPLIGSVRFLATHRSFKEKHPEEFAFLVEAYKRAFESEEYQEYLQESNAIEVSAFRGPEASDKLNLELHEILKTYKEEIEESE